MTWSTKRCDVNQKLSWVSCNILDRTGTGSQLLVPITCSCMTHASVNCKSTNITVQLQ